MNNCQAYWNECLHILKDNLSASAYSTWFAGIVPFQYENDELVLQVKSEFIVSYIEENYIDLLAKTIQRVFGKGTRLSYRVLIGSSADASTTLPSQNTSYASAPSTPFSPRISLPELDSRLNASYTFDTFVMGQSNNIARSVGISVSDKPGATAFNPLFIFGGSGVGKTHLAQAIGQRVKQLFPQKRVLYVSAHLFQTQYQDAHLSNHINEFINFYQTIDVLIVDDVQYWAGKKGTQDVFFQIFNYLQQTRKQIILTSDRAPVDLKDIQDRLLSRFKWGIAAEISRPDFQLRKDILLSKIRRDGLEIPEESVDYIAKNICHNIRDLEGVLASMLAYSMLSNVEIDMALTEQVVGRLVQVKPDEVDVNHITECVCSHFNIPLSTVASASRQRNVVNARKVAMYLAKQLTSHSLSEIGLAIGNRDHASVLYAIKEVEKLLASDARFSQVMKQLKNEILG